MFGLFKSLDQKVEEDTQRFIAELKQADIQTLIKEMDNNDPISQNIVKRQKRDKSFGSTNQRSWFAYRVSDELADPNMKIELKGLLDDNDFTKYRQYVLRCLASLCVNTTDYELFDFLMGHLKHVNEEEKVTTVLSRLNDLVKPKSLNIEYLKQLLTEGTYQNRIDALNALKNCEHDDLEDLLIREFKTADQHTKGMICATLRSTGSFKSIEMLEQEHRRTRSNDLKYFIESAIKEINSRSGDVA